MPGFDARADIRPLTHHNTELVSAEPTNNRHWVLGTSGHIDHGKSTLVRALTGVDPDRLPEEKKRGMTIELGFAPLQIGERHFGIVDVPGHEKFVRTMVAGATGIDLALLVVAADDGVMPQTREHAQILDLLGVDRGCVALTKIDLVSTSRVQDVRAQIGELIAATSLRSFPIVAVSAANGAGLDLLRQTLGQCADRIPPRQTSSVFRMHIDRAFTIRGRGTVVTGSVLSGQARPGDLLELLPDSLSVRVRELQTHGQADGTIGAGQRAALNLTGIKHDRVRRGQELATPGFASPTRCLDVAMRLLPDANKPLLSHSTVRLCIGTLELPARLVVFGDGAIEPGTQAFAQLRPRQPVAVQHGQRFIMRHETATHTLGGGVVLRPVSRRNAAKWPENLAGFEALQTGTPLDRTSETLRRLGFGECSDLHLACRAGLEPERVESLIAELRDAGTLVQMSGLKRPVHRMALDDLLVQACAFLERWHRRHSNEPGFPADRFLSWLSRRAAMGDRQARPELARSLRDYLLQRRAIRTQERFVCHASFVPALSNEDRTMLDTLLNRYKQSAFRPPRIAELRTELGRTFPRAERMIQHALSQKQLVRIDAELLLHADAYDRLNRKVKELIKCHGHVTISQVRQALESTRKFVVPFLEHLDRTGLTRRNGDKRALV